jgi:hypothetical protein
MMANKPIKDINRIPAMIKKFKRISRKKIRTGVFSGEIAKFAAVNEFGVKIRVTNKMRAYLHSEGLHLKSDTTEIVIPERSFIRSTFDKSATVKKITRAASEIFELKENGDVVLTQIGQLLSAQVQRTISSNIKPKNHWFTIKKKGKGKGTLVDEGTLKTSIVSKVV